MWKHYIAFFLVSAWVIIPLTNGFMQFIHLIFGGDPNDVWSVAVVTPIVEEMIKLFPLLVFLFLSKKASSLSLSDYALIGAATGAGFQFVEEVVRRLTYLTSVFDYGEDLFGTVKHWELFTLFPGYFEYSSQSITTASHSVHTALIALGIGMAIRFRPTMNVYAYFIPALCLTIGIWDHALWNGSLNDFPNWILSLHEFFGSGYMTKPLLVLLLIAAIIYDYWSLNRVRNELPSHQKKTIMMMNPVSETWQPLKVFIFERKHFYALLSFLRERRELGFILLYGNSEAEERRSLLNASLQKYYATLITLAGVCIITFAVSGWMLTLTGIWSNEACFACHFEALQDWWDGLEWYERGALTLGAFAVTFPFLGFWSAAGFATTAAYAAGSGQEIANVMRNPDQLLSPEYAMAAAVGLGLSRIPGGQHLGFGSPGRGGTGGHGGSGGSSSRDGGDSNNDGRGGSGPGHTGTVWDDIRPTQDNMTGSNIPTSFELTSGSNRYWVHPNATEHMWEYSTHNVRYGDLDEQQLLRSFQGSVEQATREGFQYNEVKTVGNWELIFSPPRSGEQLPVIKHAVYRP